MNNLVDNTSVAGPLNPECATNIVLTDGGVALSIALPVAFFTSLTILLSICCATIYSSNTPSYYSRYGREIPSPTRPLSYVSPTGSVQRIQGSVLPGGENEFSTYQVVYSETGVLSSPAQSMPVGNRDQAEEKAAATASAYVVSQRTQSVV